MPNKTDLTHSNSAYHQGGALSYTSTLSRVPTGYFCLTYNTDDDDDFGDGNADNNVNGNSNM